MWLTCLPAYKGSKSIPKVWIFNILYKHNYKNYTKLYKNESIDVLLGAEVISRLKVL